jgi:type I restriction enzyme R subunit
MNKPSEQKTVQARIFAYVQEIGWSLVSRDEAEFRRGETKGGQGCPPSLFFEDLLHGQVLKFTPRCFHR